MPFPGSGVVAMDVVVGVTVTNAGSGYVSAPMIQGQWGFENRPVLMGWDFGSEHAARESEANHKSLALMKEWLTSSQLEEYGRHGYFTVKGSKGGEYRVTEGRAHNVERIEGGMISEKLCFMPEGTVGAGDQMLAQKIILETDEDRALAVANHSPPYGGDGVGFARQVAGGLPRHAAGRPVCGVG